MPELGQNFFTTEWVVIATERAKRPEQLIVHREPRPQVFAVPELSLLPGEREPDAARGIALAQRRRVVESARDPKQVCRARA